MTQRRPTRDAETIVTAEPVAPNAPAPPTFLSLDALRPNSRNPRVHGDDVTRLARTILRTAWGAPIIVQARSHRIIGGHGRLEAARAIMRGVEIDGEVRGGPDFLFDPHAPAPGFVPVRIVDVSDAEADAMTLADNAHGLQGHDDTAALVAMAAQFGRESALMADIGMSGAELDALVKAAGDAVLDDGDTSSQLSDDLEFRIVVDCDSESQQSTLLDRFAAEGLACRALIS